MNRKEFFKKIGLGVAVAAITPKILITESTKILITESTGNYLGDFNAPAYFINDNYSWLQKWFNNPLNYFDIRPIKNITVEEQTQGFQKFFTKRLQPYSKEKLVEEHKKEILMSAIFGKYWEYSSQGDVFFERLWNMRGFAEEMVRMPNANDKVQFIYFGNDHKGRRFFKISENKYVISILSDCKIYITRKDNNA